METVVLQSVIQESQRYLCLTDIGLKDTVDGNIRYQIYLIVQSMHSKSSGRLTM